MNQDRLTTLEFWSKNRDEVSIEFPEAAPIKKWMVDNLPLQSGKIKNCFEVGCHPGRFLAMFGEFQVELNGVDFAPATKNIRPLLLKNNFRVGEIFTDDFLNFRSERKYDCVCSFGFIEHFKNWDEMIVKHLQLVNDQGYIVLEVPNYRGFFQRIPRYLFDRENFKLHNLKSMDLDRWEQILKNHGFELVSKEYFGGYRVALTKKPASRFERKVRNLILKFLAKATLLLYANKEHRDYSFFMGIIARKV